MKLSKVVHVISILAGMVGAIALVGAWLAGKEGTLLGVSQAHLFKDAIVLELIAIAASVCTLVRMQLERDNPGKSPLV